MCKTAEHIAVPMQKRQVEYAVRSDKTLPAKEFFDGLPKNAKERLLAIFAHVAQNGETNLPPVMFKHERGEIWTFKCKLDKRHIRMPCFRRDGRWIITHGFVKPPKSAWPEQEFTLANTIRDEVISAEEKLKSTQRKN